MAAASELAGRIDGVARVVMALIADLERREQLDGARFFRELRKSAKGRAAHPDLEISAQVMTQISDELDGARATRRSRARKD